MTDEDFINAIFDGEDLGDPGPAEPPDDEDDLRDVDEPCSLYDRIVAAGPNLSPQRLSALVREQFDIDNADLPPSDRDRVWQDKQARIGEQALLRGQIPPPAADDKAA